MIIDLCKPLELPLKYVKSLNCINKLCSSIEFSDELVQHKDVIGLVRDVNQFCLENRISGVHYTRAIPENILRKGLILRHGWEIRQDFLTEHGYLFSEEEILFIKERSSQYFSNEQCSIRDCRVFFNFTDIALGKSGSELLLGMYGGEQITMCFEPDDTIGLKLAEIGKPLVVRCSLDPLSIEIFNEYPWGKVLVSSYHSLINNEAYRIDFDGYQTVPVQPEDIIEIRVIEK